jgi:hypothetical protein
MSSEGEIRELLLRLQDAGVALRKALRQAQCMGQAETDLVYPINKACSDAIDIVASLPATTGGEHHG